MRPKGKKRLETVDELKAADGNWAVKIKTRPRQIRIQRMTRKWGPVRRLGRSRWRRISTNESPGFQDFEAEISLIFPRAATTIQPYLSAAVGITRDRPMNFSGSWGSSLTRTS